MDTGEIYARASGAKPAGSLTHRPIMDELIERLRQAANKLPPPAPEPPHPLYGLLHEAAHTISRLEVRIAHLETDLAKLRQDQIEAIRMAALAALMHHKPDYRSPTRLDQAARVIGEFVVGALNDLEK